MFSRIRKIPLLLFLVFLFPSLASGQGTDKNVALLLDGPLAKKGIDVLPPNVIPAFYGEYGFRGEKVRLYYTDSKVDIFSDWTKRTCGSVELYRIPRREEAVFCYKNSAGWSCFFIFPRDSEDFCVFVRTFIDRFRYFYAIAQDRSIPPLPAVLEF